MARDWGERNPSGSQPESGQSWPHFGGPGHTSRSQAAGLEPNVLASRTSHAKPRILDAMFPAVCTTAVLLASVDPQANLGRRTVGRASDSRTGSYARTQPFGQRSVASRYEAHDVRAAIHYIPPARFGAGFVP